MGRAGGKPMKEMKSLTREKKSWKKWIKEGSGHQTEYTNRINKNLRVYNQVPAGV